MNTTPIIRPGVSTATLEFEGIRRVTADEAYALIGQRRAGFVIPYPGVEVAGKQFYRLRLDVPTDDRKYTQAFQSGSHAYIPKSLKQPVAKGCIPHVQEGEIKTLSMEEAGYVAVGVGGIQSCIKKGGKELVKGLKDLLDSCEPKALAFVGDADTALIPDFAKSMLRLAKLIHPLPLLLPRLPVNSVGKGVDDIRAVLGDKFNAWFDSRTVITVDPTASAASLAMQMLNCELDNLKALTSDTAVTKEDASVRIVKLAAGFHKEAALAEISRIACEVFGFEADAFAKLVTAQVNVHAEKWAKKQAERKQGFPTAMVIKVDPKELSERLAVRKYVFEPAPAEPVPRYCLQGVPICTPGNLTAMSAHPKAGKSSAVGGLMGSTMADDEADCLGFTSKNPDGWAVVHIDTEQCPYDHWFGITNVIKRANAKAAPPWLLSYCVTGFSAQDVRASIRVLLEEAKARFGGIHSVIIDGVADGAADVNDLEEATGFVTELHALAIEFNCPIICIIHLNPGSTEKTRGHLGSHLERKAETNLKLEKDESGVTVIWADKNRKAPISKATGPRFSWCEKLKRHVSKAHTKADKVDDYVSRMAPQLKPGIYKSADLKASICKVCGIEFRSAAKVVSRLVTDGVVVEIKHGTYEVPNPSTKESHEN